MESSDTPDANDRSDASDAASEQERVARAMMRHVPFDGWTDKALAAALADEGLPAADARRIFPRGAIGAVEALNRAADRDMVASMQGLDLANMRVRDRVVAGVRVRLEASEPDREAIRRAMQLLALPQNAMIALRCLHRTVDAIWYAAGDTAADFNWYTKRGLLAAVYSSTVMFWINDRSPDCAATWDFLERRIDSVMRLPGTVGKLRDRLQQAPNPIRLFRDALHGRRRGRNWR